MKYSGRVFLAVSLPLFLAACDPRPQSEVNPKSVLDFFSKIEGPEVNTISDTLLQSAKDAENKRQYGRALQFYQQVVDKDPDNLEHLASLAECYRRIGDFQNAVKRYDQILAIDPANLDALEGKGLALLSKGDFDEASAQFQSVMAKNGTRWRTLNGVAILFVIKEMPKEALAYYEEALKQKPDEPAVLNNVGLTLAMTQDYPRAVQALSSASERLDAGSEERRRADLNLALVYGLSGDLESAEDVASKHLKESALNNNLGFYAYLADNKELAKAYLNNALSGSSVFYEKAWKNLEIVGGSKRTDSRYNQRSRAGYSDPAPFSSYEEDEMYIPSDPVAAPVSSVGSGGELQDLTPPKLPEKVNSGAMNQLAPAVPTVSVAPVTQNPIAPQKQAVSVFPAVPVRPILDEANVKPVSMPIAATQAVNVQTNTVSQVNVGDRITVPSMEEMTPKFSPETSSRVLPQELPQVNYTAPNIAQEMPALEQEPLANDTSKPLYRIKNPAEDIIVFQKPKEKVKKAKRARGGQDVVYQKKAEPKAEAAAPVVAEEPAEKVVERQPVNQQAVQSADNNPADEPLLRAPQEQDPNVVTQPVQQKSTVDYFKQIF